MRREAVNFSMYSDMSIWMSESASPNMNSASVRARKVLPTPVGPRKMNEPIGRRGSFRSARERRSALLMAVTASSWPMTDFFSSPSMARSLRVSFWSMRASGMPVHLEMTWRISSSPTTTSFSSRWVRHSDMIFSSLSRACFSLSRSPAAFSKSCALIAASFCPRISSISTSRDFTSGGRVMFWMRARAPASSITSMALSGKKRPVR